MSKTRTAAHLATFPPRSALLESNIQRLLEVFGSISICLNEFDAVPGFLKGDPRIKAFIPRRDHKDVGKFANLCNEDTDVFLIDDDIEYPHGYADRMRQFSNEFSTPVVLGVHGVTYRGNYAGGRSGRSLFRYYSGLSRFAAVDVLGTGTVMFSGLQPPPFEFMDGSEGFVDVRFSRYCARLGVPRICVPRPSCWLTVCEHDGSKLFADVTSKESFAILREVEEIVEKREACAKPRQMPGIPKADRMRIAVSLPRGLAYRSRRTAMKVLRAAARTRGNS